MLRRKIKQIKSKQWRILALPLLILVAFAFSGFYGLVSAAPDKVLNYQGKLTDNSNVPVADTTYSIKFTIWDAAGDGAGSCLWTAQGTLNGGTCSGATAKTVSTVGGIFSSMLGEAGDNAMNLDFNSNYWLQIQVGADSPMSPRRQITASGFAINAGMLNGQSAPYYLDISATAQTKAGDLTTQGVLTVGNSNADYLIVYGGNASGDIRTSAGALTVTPDSGNNLNVNLSGNGDLAVNTNQLYVDTSAGNVGIGTTSPAYKLDIVGTLGVGSTAYFASNVGIGTTAPPAKLTVAGGDIYLASNEGDNSRLLLTSNNSSTYVSRYDINDVQKSYLGLEDTQVYISSGEAYIQARGNNNAAERTKIDMGAAVNNTGENVGMLLVSDFSALDTASDSYTAIKLNISDTASVNVTTKNLMDLQTGSVSKFLVTSAGNVGIGTTSPGQNLSVVGNVGIGNTSAFYNVFQTDQAQGVSVAYTLPTTSPVASGYALVSTTDGVMSWAAMTGGGMSNPMTTAGDIIYAGASGSPLALTGSGTNGWVLTYNTGSNAPEWAAGGGGHTQNTDTGTTGASFVVGSSLDSAAVDLTMQFGGTGPETLTFDGNGTDNFLLSDDLDVSGGLTATTINGNTFTTGTGVLTLAAGKTLTANNTLTFTGTDSSSVAFGAGGTVAYATDLHNVVTLGTDQNGLSLATQVLSLGTASSTTTGSLTSGDWGIFNGKQAGSTNLTSLSGLSYASTSFVKMTGANTFSLDTNTYALSSATHTQHTDTGTTGVSFNIGSATNSTTTDTFLQFGSTGAETLTFDGDNTDNFLLSDDLDVSGGLTATTINGNTFTTGTGVLTLAAGKTLTANNTLTFTGTDSSSVAFGAGGTVAYATDLHNVVTLGTDQNGLSLATQVLSLGTASSTTTGSLTSGDWGIFNGKQAGSSNLTSLSGLTFASTSFVKMTGANTFALDTAAYLSDGSVYALLAGRAGSQVLNGGTAASEILRLSSTANGTKGKVVFGTGGSGYDELNNRLGVGTTNPSYKLDVLTGTAVANERGVNISNITTAAGTNYGIYSSVTGASTTNIGVYSAATGATTSYGVQVADMTSATSRGVDIGAMSGGTNNIGVNIGGISGAGLASMITTGNVTSTGATAYQLSLGAVSGANATQHMGISLGGISGTTPNAYGINVGSVTGGTTANYGINVTSSAAVASATNYGINIGGITGTAATSTNYGLNIGTMSATGTATYGLKIAGPSGAATSNYGMNITQPTGATHDAALVIGAVATGAGDWSIYNASTADSYFAGNIGVGTAATTTTFLDLGAPTTAKSSLRLEPSAAVNPSSPVSGDIWFNGTNLYFRKGTVTSDLLPMTTAGDIVYGGTSGAPARLAGSASDGYVLKYNTATNIPYWSTDLQGSGSQTPWAQDVDAAGYILSNIGNTGTDFVATTGALTLAGVLTANGGVSMGAQALNGTTGVINYTGFDVDASGNLDALGTLTAGSGNVQVTDAAGKVQHDSIVDCADGQILKWATAGGWACAADATGSGGAPDTAAFLDTTPAAFADNNTTEIWNDATRPNITTDSATATVMISVHMHGIASNTTADSFIAARLVYTNDQTNPSCTTSAQVGEIMVGGFTTTTLHPWSVSGTFLHTPSTVAEEIRYTVCSSSVGIVPTDTAEDVRVDIVELGADLAENYRTTDESVSPGDVVAIDPFLTAGVKKSNGAYDSQVIGVISTNPGITLDDATSWGQGRSVPVALAGRIPVKVSAENGRVNAGDYLTASSVPGVAMKATKAGPVIGQALQNFGYLDSDIGLVVAFVKTSYFTGTSLAAEVSGLTIESVSSEVNEESFNEIALSKKILALLLAQKENNLNTVNLSEISTDRLTAGLEIITPKVEAEMVALDKLEAATGLDMTMNLADGGTLKINNNLTGENGITFDSAGNGTFQGTLTADAIVANKILGLEIYTNQLSGIDENVSVLSSKLDGLRKSVEEPINLSDLGILEKKGGLMIAKETTFQETTMFEKLATFAGNVIFHGKISFEKTPTFSSDTAGYAVVKEGSNTVSVNFDEEYAELPVVNASLSIQQIKDEDVRKAAEELLLLSDVKFIITNVTKEGFEIRIDQIALSEIPFAWTALAVKNVKTFESESVTVIPNEISADSVPADDASIDLIQDESPVDIAPLEAGATVESTPIVVVPSNAVLPVEEIVSGETVTATAEQAVIVPEGAPALIP